MASRGYWYSRGAGRDCFHMFGRKKNEHGTGLHGEVRIIANIQQLVEMERTRLWVSNSSYRSAQNGYPQTGLYR